VRVTIESEPEQAPDIRQLRVEAEQADKLAALTWVLAAHPHESALVFANMKVTVAEVCNALASAGVSVAALHGDLEQFDRDQVLARFRNRSARVLVATDVAARGLDVKDLDLVVNYDLPPQPETYVHRIGRTGRAGRSGVAVSICTPREDRKVEAIVALTGAVLERVTPPAEAPAAPVARAAAMDTIQISGGRKDKVRPGDILGALTGDAGGLPASDVGKIEIHDHFSYVAVSAAISARAVRSLTEGKIKGRKFLARIVG
jgi:ATP-independent RNA helicase DbpA